MRILREPLLHFLVLGTLVYGATRAFDPDTTQRRIEAGPEQRARLALTYREQYGVPPTQDQLQHLVDEYVRTEILYREGMAMGLAQGDEIVKRRVVQKLQFVNENLDAQSDPTPAQLAAYLAAHRGRYESEPEATFTHVFFAADPAGDAVAQRRATGALKALQGGQSERMAAGDPFVQGQSFAALTRSSANALFGESPLTAALFSAPRNGWSGPFRSAYGWHVIRVSAIAPPRAASLELVAERVRADYLAEQRERANDAAFQHISSKYQVVTSGPGA